MGKQKKFWSRKFRFRLIGNWGISFLGPLVGANIVLTAEFMDTVLISLISSTIVIGLVFFRRLEQVGR